MNTIKDRLKFINHFASYVNKKLFDEYHSTLIESIEAYKSFNLIYIHFKNKWTCEISNCNISIKLYPIHCEYEIKNYEIITHYLAKNQTISEQYKNDNPEIFKILTYIIRNREHVYKTMSEAINLYVYTNYYNNIPKAKTFLLCNHITKIFPHGIDKIITHKILFFFFFLFSFFFHNKIKKNIKIKN